MLRDNKNPGRQGLPPSFLEPKNPFDESPEQSQSRVHRVRFPARFEDFSALKTCNSFEWTVEGARGKARENAVTAVATFVWGVVS